MYFRHIEFSAIDPRTMFPIKGGDLAIFRPFRISIAHSIGPCTSVKGFGGLVRHAVVRKSSVMESIPARVAVATRLTVSLLSRIAI